ncbi:MAG: TonB family protein [Bacteroidales bacterium]|nr:TonB family protein [Bacteroidales bacterium]
MDARKSLKADLEAKKTIFFEIGLVLVLALVYFSLNAKSYEQRKAVLVQQQAQNTPEEMVPITEQKVKPPPPPPPKQVTQIKIVSNDVKIDDNVDIDVNADMNTQVAQYTPPVQEEDVQEQPIFTVVEDKPSFPGGEAALMKFLATHIQYPALAKESGIQGRVFISFVVEPSGNIDHVKVLRGIGGGCDEEAIRVVKSMPKWEPGRQRGKPVRVAFTLPINFKLE